MTSAFYRNHDYSTDVIIFGGNIQRKSRFDKHVVTETRVLKFGMYILWSLCISHIQQQQACMALSVSYIPRSSVNCNLLVLTAMASKLGNSEGNLLSSRAVGSLLNKYTHSIT